MRLVSKSHLLCILKLGLSLNTPLNKKIVKQFFFRGKILSFQKIFLIMPLVENPLKFFSASNGEWPHVVRLSPSGLIEWIVAIQWFSFHLWYSISSLSIEWFNKLKCLATGFSIQWWFMSERWPISRIWSAFSVSPTYWTKHFFAFYEVDDVTGLTVCSSFDPKLFTSGCTAERDTQFYMCTRFAAWLSTSSVPPVGFFQLSICHPY